MGLPVPQACVGRRLRVSETGMSIHAVNDMQKS